MPRTATVRQSDGARVGVAVDGASAGVVEPLAYLLSLRNLVFASTAPNLGRMADSEFEEFRQYFDQLPQHIRAPAKCYT